MISIDCVHERDARASRGDKVYIKTPLPNGHFEHRNILFKFDPQPSSLNEWTNRLVLNGELYEMKGLHTQYNPQWTKEKIIHDMAYASKNKTIKPGTISQTNPQIKNGNHDLNQQWILTIYESNLLDGTSVMIKHVNYHRYNLQQPFNNHYSYFEFQ